MVERGSHGDDHRTGKRHGLHFHRYGDDGSQHQRRFFGHSCDDTDGDTYTHGCLDRNGNAISTLVSL